MAFAVADVAGRILASQVVPTRADQGAGQALRRALQAAAELAAEASRSGSEVLAFGLSTMGITAADCVRLAPTVDGWEELRIPAQVHAALPGIPVAIGNDVRAGTLAEIRWGVLRGISEAIYLNLGTGVGAGLVTGGQVLTGAHGAAGEIGYLLRGPQDLAGRRPGSGPLEQAVSGKAILRRTAAELGRPLGFGQLAEAAGADPAANALLREVMADVQVAVANLALTFDPEVLVVGGGFARSPAPLIAGLRAAVQQAVPFPPSILASRFSGDAALHGAIALALDAAASGPADRRPSANAVPPPIPQETP